MSSYRPLPGDSSSGSERARILDVGGREIPNTDSMNGSLKSPRLRSACWAPSREDIEPSRARIACRLPGGPTLGCFLLKTFERGLSMVDADEPETREGVRVLVVASSLG